jgi:hypothetical protein
LKSGKKLGQTGHFFLLTPGCIPVTIERLEGSELLLRLPPSDEKLQ